MGDFEELVFTKKLLNAIISLDDLGDSTKDKNKLIRGFCNIFQKTLECQVAIFMFTESEKIQVSCNTSDFNESEAKKIALITARDFETSYDNSPEHFKNFLSIPLGVDSADGIIFCYNKETGFSKQDVDLAEKIEAQADSILEHAKTHNNLLSRAKELEVLYKIDHIRDSITDFDKMLNAILVELHKVIPSNNSFITLYDKSGNIKNIKLLNENINTSFVRKVSELTINRGHLQNEVFNDQFFLCIPLILEKKVIGVFGVIKDSEFSKQDERILTAIASQADTAIFEDQKKTRIKDVFKRYVSEHVVEEMLNTEDHDFLAGKRIDMSVLFADIRGFTSFTEKSSVTKLVDYINLYLGSMTEVIMKHNATLDKFVGDEVMALFGAPIWYPDHAIRAVKTAIDMQKRMQGLNEYWRKLGDDSLHIGIGINSGSMFVGNIGTEKMADYTVLGDNVNLGARLCSAAKKDQILISKHTYELIKDHFDCKKLDPIKVKGKEHEVEIFEIVY